MLTKVRAFRITARYSRAKKRYEVQRDIIAIDENKALEKFFSELGRQGLKRNEITVTSVKEITLSEIRNPKLRKIALSENPVIYIED